MKGPVPSLPVGAVVVLSTVGPDGPHAIPVSAARMARSGLLLLALSANRGSLARLRDEPAVAVTIIETGFAQTLRGRARVACENLPGAAFMAVVEITVDAIDDHLRPDTLIESGVRWAWTDEAMAEKDRAVVAALGAIDPADLASDR